MNQQPQQPQINLKNTTSVTNSNGGSLFLAGVILRKISKFAAGTKEDGVMPIQVFYCPSTYKILGEYLPADLREELKDECI